METKLSRREYAALPDQLREAMRLENLHDVLVGKTPRKRVLASTRDIKHQSGRKGKGYEIADASDATRVIFPQTHAPLTPREARVLFMRHEVGMTLQQISQQLKMNRGRTREIEVKALRKLKHPSRSRKLRSFLDR